MSVIRVLNLCKNLTPGARSGLVDASRRQCYTACVFTQIDHIGLAVHDLDAALHQYRHAFALTAWEIIDLPERHMRAAIAHVGESMIELITPTSALAAFARFLTTRGEGMHHVAYRVDDIVTAIADLRTRGVQVLDTTPRPGLHGTQVAFLHPASCHGTLVELVQHTGQP